MIAKLLGSRLVLRIVLVGIVQFALVAAGLFVLSQKARPPSFFRDHSTYVGETLAAHKDDPEGLAREISRVERTLRWHVSGYDAAGNLVLGAPKPQVSERKDGERRGPPDLVLTRADGSTLRLVFSPPPPPQPRGIGSTVALVLVVVGVASWLVARSVSAPLGAITAATRAFGRGELGARVALKRRDELGEVSRAFDEMADRVEIALHAERELLANVSHELRTPLQRIRIAIDLASEGNAETARESLAEIAEDLAELERIVDDVLTAARLSIAKGGMGAGAPPIRREEVALLDLVEKAAARFRSAHPDRELVTAFADDLAIVEVDPVLFRRAVDNLLQNASRYSEAPSPVSLSARVAEGGVRIEVEDRGIGMSDADVARAFEPFFRADKSRTRASGGLGLGLALARRIVEAHGGTLVLESALGVGTIAKIVVPPTAPQAS